VSASHGNQVADLLQSLISQVSLYPSVESQQSGIKLALVGRTNVGKSTLLNQILGEERAIVSPIAGTTRDAVDSGIVIDDQHFVLIDTAGIRKKRAEKDPVDKFAAIRTEEAIQRADVCALILDARDGITHIEKKILMRIEEVGKGCLLFLNKWDLVKGVRMEHVKQELILRCPALNDFPILIGSAIQRRNISTIFKETKEIYTQLNQRISTGQLNRFIEKAIQKYHPPMIQGKRLRIFYLTQVNVHPPTFVLFVNHPHLMTDSYKKYLLNQLREVYGFKGVPIKIELKARL
jgi:GTP-binding protein